MIFNLLIILMSRKADKNNYWPSSLNRYVHSAVLLEIVVGRQFGSLESIIWTVEVQPDATAALKAIFSEFSNKNPSFVVQSNKRFALTISFGHMKETLRKFPSLTTRGPYLPPSAVPSILERSHIIPICDLIQWFKKSKSITDNVKKII